MVADANGLFPPIYLSASFDYKVILKDSAGVTIATRDPIGFTPAVTAPPSPSYLNGLTIQNAGGVSTFTVASGSAADTTNISLMKLAASLTKTTTAWAVGGGSGALDTGAIANTTTYHVHEIQRTDTGVVDILISLSATTPTLPANYTLFRRIRSMRTDGSAHWIADVQDGDLIELVTLANEVNTTNPGIAAVTRTLTSIPTGINVQAIVQLVVANGDGTSCFAYLSDLATTDSTPQSGLSDITNSFTGTIPASRVTVRTNTSAQIRSRISYSSANVTFIINTLGYIDSRGKNV